jgi:hypothetical protein
MIFAGIYMWPYAIFYAKHTYSPKNIEFYIYRVDYARAWGMLQGFGFDAKIMKEFT